MYYTVPEIALPARDSDERWQVISDCNIPELFDSWKHFKCSANIYLIHLEELDLTSNKKVSVLILKCGKNVILT